MDAIEKAVRNALEKGDAADKNYRRRVYVSARHALEKSMAGRSLTQDMVDERFSRLAEVAAMIETGFSVAMEEIQVPSPARRSYEAPAPHLDETAQTPLATELEIPTELLETFAAEPEAQTSDMEQPTGDIWVIPIKVPPLTADLPIAEPHAIPEVEAPEPPAKPTKKGNGGKKSSKKLLAEPIVEAIASSEPVPDLFGHTEPVWDEVSITPESELESLPATLEQPETEAELPLEFDMVDDSNAEIAEPDEFDAGDLARLDGSTEADMPIEPENMPVSQTAESSFAGSAIEPENVPELNDEVVSEKHFEVTPVVIQEEKQTLSTSESKPARQAQSRRQPRRGMAFAFIMATLVAFLVMGIWIAYSTGALKLRGSEDVADTMITVDPRDEPAPVVSDNQTSTAAAPASTADDWLIIFRPDNPGDLVVDPTISAKVTGTGPLANLRIEPAASTAGDAAVVFSIGQGILEQIAGKSAVFDIVAAADDGKPTQISVICDFAGLGDCGRKRYQIDAANSDNLFQIEFPAGKPTGDGQVIVNPDVDGKGRALQIYAIKVRVAN